MDNVNVANVENGADMGVPAAAATEPAAKKDWRTAVYVGDELPVTELKRGDAIQAVGEIPAVKGQWGTNQVAKMPRLLTIERVEDSIYGPTHKRIVVREPRNKHAAFNRRVFDIPVTYTVNRLSGRLGRELMAEFAKFIETQAFENVPRLGITSGSDPEIFVEDKDGKVIPAYKFLPAKSEGKDSKAMTYRDPPGQVNNVYWDGFQAEFDTVANNCLAFHVDSIRHGLNKLHKMALDYDKGAKLSTRVVVEADPNELENARPEHVEFGCAPSENAYGIKGRLAEGRKTPFRFAGGHIHLGLGGKQSKPRAEKIVKAMDAILGVSCVALFASFDNPIRRQYYGLPGEYRLPPHGIEYRVLSNAWLTHPIITHMVFDLARAAASVGDADLLSSWKAEEKETIDCIATSNVTQAKDILARNKNMWLGTLKMWGAYTGVNGERAFGVFNNGLESIIKDPADLKSNWSLGGAWGNHTDNDSRTWGRASYEWKEGRKW